MKIQLAITLLALGSIAARAQIVTIDDFSTGAYHQTPLLLGQSHSIQTGSMVGGSRQILFSICTPPCSNPFEQPSWFEVRPSSTIGVPSALIMTSGYYMSPGITLTYGLSTPLNLDVTSFGANDRFRLSFHGANAPLRVDLVVRSGARYVDFVCAIPFTGLAALPLTVDLPFNAFPAKGLDFSHVDLIQLVNLGGNGVVDVDFALASLRAVPASPATFACGTR
jgi:hypothetical protein